ncbi:MAG: DUF3667 domain-containing protein [Balneola sp.]|jgi:hypothetical protein|nr:DUF3667 domain-containing protein [Balneola sp.]
MLVCNNCRTEFEGNFCPNCGQRSNSGRIVFRESVRDVLEHYFDFDAPLIRTVKGLITNPGKLIREYIAGRRKSYSHPFRYFIFVLAIYLILKSFLDFDPIQMVSDLRGVEQVPSPDTTIAKASNYFSNHINAFLLIFALTIALFSKLFNFRSKVYFVEYLTLGFFVIGEYMLFSIFILIASTISAKFFLLNYLVVFLYPVYVLVSFHSGNLFLRILKSLLISVLAWTSYSFLGFTISIFIVKIFGL